MTAAWQLSSSSARTALDVVDGTGPHEGQGPHYSRRSPGSKTFTGCGQEIVLVTDDGRAVWACIHQRTPTQAGSVGQVTPYVWRNMLFRNLGSGLSSDLIRAATERTYVEWRQRYGELPTVQLRTEIDVKRVRSGLPGYCYLRAGWKMGPLKRGKRFLYAPKQESGQAVGVRGTEE